jgi:TolB-like protein/rhodanese-related sulfurtransferase
LPTPTGTPKTKWSSRHLAAGAVVIVSLVVVTSGIIWLTPWSKERIALPLPDKPSIAVLPFANMSDDPKQEYFVDGMTEDLTTDLSKISGLFVIARNSAFAYKGKSLDVRQISHELGVKYVLEGSVRRAGEQVRINAQLIDATTGGHVWAERYDGSLAGVFELQDRVTEKIVAALAVTLTAEEAAQHVDQKTSNPQAYDAFLQGWAHYQLHTPASLAEAVPYFEKAVRLDSSYSHAHAALAAVYWESWNNGWVESLGVSFLQASRQARAHLEEAMRRPTPLAHWVASNILASSGEDYEQAVREAERAVVLEPNNATGHAALATALILAGNAAKGAESIKTAMRLDPLYPSYVVTLGQAQFALERFKDAAVTLERAVARNPDNEWAWVYLAATYGHLGTTEDGEAALETYNELRIQHGLAEFVLEQVDHWRLGRPDRDRVRTGLSKIPDPEWKVLITRGPEGLEVQGVPRIDTATAKALHERGARFADLQYWTQDWIAGHIPGAVRLEAGRLSKARFREIVGSKDQELVFYGSSTSATQACAKAITWGYKHVYQFPDGMRGWRAAGHPIEKRE